MFGRYGGFPFRFGGGGETNHQIEHEAILAALEPAYDVSEDSDVWCEAYAHARALAMIWAVNKRIENQAFPLRMLENLPVWEEATGLRPTVDDTDQERRRRLAAKLRGLVGNTLADIIACCEAQMGGNFDQVVTVAPTDLVVWMPGGPAVVTPGGVTQCSAPGRPGFEWSSNRCVIGVRLTKNGVSENDFLRKRSQLAFALDALCPTWLRFQIGVGSGFVVGQGVLGQTFL